MTFAEDNIRGPARQGLLAKISEAAAKSFDWGIQLALELQDKGLWETDFGGPFCGHGLHQNCRTCN